MQAGNRHDDMTAAHTYGTLATQLNEALSQARQALDPHAEHLPGGTLAGLDALLADFARRRIRIALYGEVKAGKSTLLNAVAGATLSPVAFEPLTSVPVRVTHGPTTAWRIADRRLDNVAALERLMRDGATDAGEVVVETNVDLLQLGGQVDLLDTPGVGSDDQFDAITAEALRALDAVVLVVRYPALFTQFTRRLVDSLEADISKLFVVWNLDAACTELSPEERRRHAETLRTAVATDTVAGAHELFLVDARGGGGLTDFTDALRRFVSSGDREIAAVREAAKRAQQWLGHAEQWLTARHDALARALAEARERLHAAQAKAEADTTAERTRLADFEAAVTRIGQQGTATAATLAADLRRQLRAARRRWIRSGDLSALDAAVASAAGEHADAAHAARGATWEALQAEATHFGSLAPGAAHAHAALVVGQLAPEDRSQRAINGRAQLLRRALWRRWYLPGLATLERAGIEEDQATHAAWLATVTSAVCSEARHTLAARLESIAQRAVAESQQIKDETNFSANEAEFERLTEHVPIIATQAMRVAEIGTDARRALLA